jgi:hypothetical protein
MGKIKIFTEDDADKARGAENREVPGPFDGPAFAPCDGPGPAARQAGEGETGRSRVLKANQGK